MKTRVNTVFVVSGDSLVPEAFTQVLELTPSSFNTRGQGRGVKRPPAPTGEWVLETGWTDSDDLESGITSLVDVLWNKREELLRLVQAQNARIGFVSVVEIVDMRPELSLSSGTIVRLAGLNAEYSIDLYDFRKRHRNRI